MISHRHRCLYVKVPKCAGASVLAWFAAHGGGRPSFRPAWHGGPLSRRMPDVARVNLYPDYLTLAFLRDPWDRFVSLWLELRRVARARRGARPELQGLATLAGFAELCMDLLADFGPCWDAEAEAAFRAKRDRVCDPGGVRLGALGWSAGRLWPQTAFLPDCNPERLFGVARVNARPLDFIGLVGRMEEDFAGLGRLLGLPDAPLPRCNASGARGVTACGGYARHYEAFTRRAAETLYAADIAFTGCAFGEGRRSMACQGKTARHRMRNAVRLPPARRPLRTLPARVRRELWSLRAGLEAGVLRVPAVRRLLRPPAARRGPG